MKISRARTHRGPLRGAALVCLCLFTTATAHAAMSVLDNFFNKLQSISADFEQTVSNAIGAEHDLRVLSDRGGFTGCRSSLMLG